MLGRSRSHPDRAYDLQPSFERQKFTHAGGEVKVSLRNELEEVELVVEDTGRGIAPDHLPHIFDRFYRVPDTMPRPERGLGLGLSFVAWIAKATKERYAWKARRARGAASSCRCRWRRL